MDNPLDFYPERDWERVYRDQFSYDSTFHFLCAPNDTHNCLLKAYVKNNIITRIGPSYGYGKATDIYGHRSSARWEPRLCNKGLSLIRRIYGPRRAKTPLVREGFKKWVEAGFPRLPDGRPPRQYLNRGKEPFVRVSWEEAFDLAARAMVNIARTYSGEKGRSFLEAQGYESETIEAMQGAGSQTMKFRGGMPLLGITQVFGMYRLANSLALLDSHVRGVDKDQALGGRGWDNYSWHTDLPPGHPMVTGQQTVEFDLVCAEHAELIIAWGMNWISTKMPDAHWLTEARLKGTRVVSVTVEYSSVASKSDEVVIIRPATDPAFALGLAYVILEENLYDEEFVKSFTDLPFLVRLDTLKLLRAEEIFPDFRSPQGRRETHIVAEGEKAPSPLEAKGKQCIPEKLLAEWGNFVVWDEARNVPLPVTRDDVGTYFRAKNITPALEGQFEVEINGKKVGLRTVFSLVRQYIRENFDPKTVSRISGPPRKRLSTWLTRSPLKEGRL